MSKEAYVHEGVSLICTNGFKPAKLLVKDRGVCIAGGQLMATEEDKPTNFACKWAGVLAALIAAILITAPFIVAVLAAFLIGMLAALTLGQLLCWVALQGGKWNMVHPQVKLKGQCALTESSKLTCVLMGGDITIFYDEATAGKALRNNWLRNSVEILGTAFMGRAFGASLKVNGFTGAVKGFVLALPRNLVLGYGMVEGADIVSNITTQNENGLTTGMGGSIPYYGENKNIGDITQADYQKTSTEPIGIPPTNETTLSVNRRMQKKQDLFKQYEQSQISQYKQNHPVHQYSRGKKSPHYGRQQQQKQKINIRAKKYGANQRSKLSQRYQNRVRNSAQKKYSRANYGLLAAFFLSEVVSQHLEKSLTNEIQKNNSPESRARAASKIYAVDR